MVGHGKRNAQSSTSISDKEFTTHSRRRKNQDPGEVGPTSSKRRRVTRACDQCRHGREKCDGSRPCHTCQTADRQCTFQGESKRRGVQPGYIRALEALVAWTLTNVSGADVQLRELLAREPVTDELGIFSKDASTSEDLTNTWMQSQLHKDLDQLLSSKGASHEANLSTEGDHDRVDEHQIAEINFPQFQDDVEMDYGSSTLPTSIAGFRDETMPQVLARTYGAHPDHPGNTSPLDSLLLFQPDYNTSVATGMTNVLDTRPHPVVPAPSFGDFDFFGEQALPFSQSSPSALDAFLDELATAEYTETSNQQPQFMQNLGLGPDMSPSEMMNDAGEWLIP